MKSVALVILDGFGIAAPGPGNAIAQARTPNFSSLEREAVSGALQASGVAVGLPWGESGNSEVGHLTLGTGRIIYQHLPRIIFAIRDGSFFSNEALVGAMQHAKSNDGTLHIMGLLSSGTVHSYIDHFYALLELAQREGLKHEQVSVHVFTDGRDAIPTEAASFLPQIQSRMQFLKIGRIATFCGRFFAMDRGGNWDRTERAYRLLTQEEGTKVSDPIAYLNESYVKGVTDEFIEPAVVSNGKKDSSRIKTGDAVVFLNFREDSVRQLARAFVLDDFPHFAREKLGNLYFATMTEYEAGLPAHAAFTNPPISDSIGEVIAKTGLRQLRIAETEKYAHVTYFFNGGREEAFPNEARILVPSTTEPHFETNPQMQSEKITEEVVKAIERSFYELIVVNFANADMIGHTGDFSATVKAVEALDTALGKIAEAVLKTEGATLIVAADHGNAEAKLDIANGRILTEHTDNPVPYYIIGTEIPRRPPGIGFIPLFQRQPEGFLSDVAPTILRILGLPPSEHMTGRSLI